MRLYFDTAYVAKCYVNENDGARVRELARGARGLSTSAWCRAEIACVFHRHLREGALTPAQVRILSRMFQDDVDHGVWDLVPVSEGLWHSVADRVSRLPRAMYIRSGDALHLVSALTAGFTEIWSNDRHLLAAAPHFGLVGRTVSG
ncbi:MAG: type II toxin-antitoxin system VapC family toxin [Acidobacteria bacterium]|nr:type II toxin-antitoxin system VapC family toxin [Acidobacteriota bacterium]